ncbi:hypothetical protein K501DRAFT_274532 [Backusella circina FSU 941]|nr:hypothetical protein K501DRAFT_274532 [Backusella circina FSU 941]
MANARATSANIIQLAQQCKSLRVNTSILKKFLKKTRYKPDNANGLDCYLLLFKVILDIYTNWGGVPIRKFISQNIQGIADSYSPSITEACTTPVSTSFEHFPSSPTLSASISPPLSLNLLTLNETHLHELFVFFTPKSNCAKQRRL